MYDVTDTSGFLAAVSALRAPVAGPVLLGALQGVMKTAEKKPKNPPVASAIDKLHKMQGDSKVSRSEAYKIRKQLKAIAPRTKTEKQVEELAGRPLTRGQLARYITLGAALGGGSGLLRKGIRAGAGGLGDAVRAVKAHPIKAPASLISDTASDVATGAIYGGVLPVVRRASDIEAARRGQF